MCVCVDAGVYMFRRMFACSVDVVYCGRNVRKYEALGVDVSN